MRELIEINGNFGVVNLVRPNVVRLSGFVHGLHLQIPLIVNLRDANGNILCSARGNS